MIKAIIFDFDGVILESSDIKTEAFRVMFERRFPDDVEDIVDHHRQNMGISRFVKFKNIYKQFAGKTLTAEEEISLGDEFSKIVTEQVLKTPMVPGALEFLEENHQQYLCFVASGTPHEELVDIVQKRKLRSYFKGVFGSPEEKVNIIFRIMEEYGLKTSEVVFVGDAESDLRAATQARVHFVARLGSSPSLEKCKYRISSLDEFKPILNLLNRG